jgi:hypothetical protein
VALSRAILVIAYHLLHDQTVCQELGSHFFDRRNAEHMCKYHTRPLQALGYNVTLESLAEAA